LEKAFEIEAFEQLNFKYELETPSAFFKLFKKR